MRLVSEAIKEQAADTTYLVICAVNDTNSGFRTVVVLGGTQ